MQSYRKDQVVFFDDLYWIWICSASAIGAVVLYRSESKGFFLPPLHSKHAQQKDFRKEEIARPSICSILPSLKCTPTRHDLLTAQCFTGLHNQLAACS